MTLPVGVSRRHCRFSPAMPRGLICDQVRPSVPAVRCARLLPRTMTLCGR
jgi:hypothetical protein